MNLLLSACGRCGAGRRQGARTVDERSRGALACHNALNGVRHPAGDVDVTGLVHVLDASTRRGDWIEGKCAATGAAEPAFADVVGAAALTPPAASAVAGRLPLCQPALSACRGYPSQPGAAWRETFVFPAGRAAETTVSAGRIQIPRLAGGTMPFRRT